MKPVILFRAGLAEENELVCAQRHFSIVHQRAAIPRGSAIVGRYSVLPYYRELETDVRLLGGRLCQSYAQHQWIADAEAWGNPYGVLAGSTPPVIPYGSPLPPGAYVVKGRTNSRKHQWSTHMFAETRDAVPQIAARLLDDPLLADQGLIVRPYVPLKRLGEGFHGLPITNEWRTFWWVELGEPVLLARGFYWGSHPEVAEQASWGEEAERLVWDAAMRVAGEATFFVLDIAETEAGNWIVIELNDGQMSGLGGVDPEQLYGTWGRVWG